MLILSLFPGVGLLDLAFEEAGCCVVRAPDLIHGGDQLRWRAIQFAHRDGGIMRPVRVTDRTETQRKGRRPIAITTKPVSIHQTFAAQCRKQGLSSPIKLAGWTKSAKFQAVGNGVPLPMGRILAAAVLQCGGPPSETDCACGCGREVAGGRHKCATDSCRKRIQKDRERARPLVDADGYHNGRTK